MAGGELPGLHLAEWRRDRRGQRITSQPSATPLLWISRAFALDSARRWCSLPLRPWRPSVWGLLVDDRSCVASACNAGRMVGAVEGASETRLQVVTTTLKQSGHAQGWAYRAPWCRRPRYEPDSRWARTGKLLSGARGRTLDSMEATSILSVTQAPARPPTSGSRRAWSTRASSVRSL